MLVIYNGATQLQVDYSRSFDDPRDVLVIGRTYTVTRWDEHAWHTNVYLKEVHGKFNSVYFTKVKEPRKEHSYAVFAKVHSSARFLRGRGTKSKIECIGIVKAINSVEACAKALKTTNHLFKDLYACMIKADKTNIWNPKHVKSLFYLI